MPKPIRNITIAAGSILTVFSLISMSIFWPRISALDWSFFRVLLIAGSPLVYVLIAVLSGRTICYWVAVGLLKLETFQWLLIECSGIFASAYKQIYPIRERQIRAGISREEDEKGKNG
jgi:hypothetical protein